MSCTTAQVGGPRLRRTSISRNRRPRIDLWWLLVCESAQYVNTYRYPLYEKNSWR